jgi:hypothetical protein
MLHAAQHQLVRKVSTIVSIHQPNYLPWLGYFHKISYSDVFVFLDDSQYTPKTYTNRCAIPQNGKQNRLSVPVSLERWDTPIRGVQLDTRTFARKHLEFFRHTYGKCQAYNGIMERLQPVFDGGEVNLANFNIALIREIASYIGLETKFVNLSDLGINTKKNQLLVDVMKSVGGDVFVSGIGAKSYIDGNEQIYLDNGVRLAYQNFEHPIYRTRQREFVKGCSIIDLAFNAGQTSGEILTSQKDEPWLEWQPQ